MSLLLNLTPAMQEELRAELIATIRNVDPKIFEEQVSNNKTLQFERYLAANCPQLHQRILDMNLMWEWCMAAQARYERRRQELLSQGMPLETAMEMATAEELRPISEEDQMESASNQESTEELNLAYQGASMSTLLRELPNN